VSTPPPLPPQTDSGPQRNYTCPNCGAQTAYAPGTTVLRCPTCGAEQAIAGSDRGIEEHSYDAWAQLPPKPVATIGQQVLTCRNCGATTETDLLAGACQFCGGVLVALTQPEGVIVPEAVVPFKIEKRAANDAFVKWVRSRWFAPSTLRKVGSTESIAGTYVPHWTYDAHTETDYTGARGEHYYTTETYTVSDGRGGSRTETRQVQHTRWYPAAGHVARDFDDVLVLGSTKITPKLVDDAGPWQLGEAVPFAPDYLAGYSALRYDVDPDAGLATAKNTMQDVVREDCRRDIGGDEQQVNHMDVRYAAVMFKLLLLPLWIASYIYAGKTYQVLVNANTGEVLGQRPYSKVKIALAVLGALIVLAAVVTLVVWSKRH
jgi:Zn finger protein HypA/HybF involved in hydrogenase expression